MTTEIRETPTLALTPEMLVEDYHRYKKQRVHGSPVAMSNWPTVLAHPCEAYGVYMRVVPPEQRRSLPDSLGMRFAEGDDQERAVKRDLLEMGYNVTGEQGQMVWPSRQISGRKDCRISKPGYGVGVEVEIKSCSPYLYSSIRSGRDGVEDIKNHKFVFVQKWYRQVCLYLVLKEIDRYWMILKDKSSGEWKVADFHRGDDETRVGCELADKAERINRLVHIGQLPDASMKISAPDLCSECEFFPVCLPELNFGLAAHILTDEKAVELAVKTDRLAELKPLAKEYEDLDDEVKAEVKALCADGGDQVVYSDWVASIKRIDRKAFTVKAGVQERVSFTKTGTAG